MWVPLLWLPIAWPVLRPQSFVSFPGASGNVIYSESRELGSSLWLPVALFESTGVGFFHGTAHVIAYYEATVVGYICVNTHSIACFEGTYVGSFPGVAITSPVLKSQDFGWISTGVAHSTVCSEVKFVGSFTGANFSIACYEASRFWVLYWGC